MKRLLYSQVSTPVRDGILRSFSDFLIGRIPPEVQRTGSGCMPFTIERKPIYYGATSRRSSDVGFGVAFFRRDGDSRKWFVDYVEIPDDWI